MPAGRLKLRGSTVPAVPAAPMRFRPLGQARLERNRSLHSRMVRLSSRKRQQSRGDENPARHERLPCEKRATRVEVSRCTTAREIG
jgi:hypothetical protein